MLYKIINNLVATPAEEFITKAKKMTRGHNQKYTQISFKKDYYGYTFPPRTIKEWNSLPSYCAESCSLKLFKHNLANHFGYKYKLKMPATLTRKWVILTPVGVMWPELLFQLNSMEMEIWRAQLTLVWLHNSVPASPLLTLWGRLILIDLSRSECDANHGGGFLDGKSHKSL